MSEFSYDFEPGFGVAGVTDHIKGFSSDTLAYGHMRELEFDPRDSHCSGTSV